MRQNKVLLLFFLSFWVALHCFSVAPAVASASEYEYLVVGIFIQKKEVDIIEVLRLKDTFFIPIDSFVQVTGSAFSIDQGVTQVITPLGEVKLYQEHLHLIDGVTYLDQKVIEEKFHTSIVFNSEEFALFFDLPWRPGIDKPDAKKSRLEPDVLPPHVSLSTIREDITYTKRDEGDEYASSTTLGGRFYGASWKVHLKNDFRGSKELSEYELFRIQGNTLFQAGLHQIRLHPLLTGFELTGAQVGWTDQPLDRLSLASDARELLSRRSLPVKTFRGRAPPGYIVQLRVNGHVESQQEVGLSGEYEFTEVPLSSHSLNQIEIYIFDYHDLLVPVEIKELTMTTSDLLLPKGKDILLAGVGVGGNWSDEFFQPEIEETYKFAGFSQWRYGVTESFTLEASVQHAFDTTQVQGGFISRFANPFVLAVGVGASNEKIGYVADLDVIFPRWRILAKSFQIPSDFHLSGESEAQWDDSVEVNYNVTKNLTLGLLARHYKADDHHSKYVLPFGTWSPVPKLTLYARPDHEGNYRLQGDYSFTSARLSVMFEDPTWSMNLSYPFKERYSLSLSSVFTDNDDDTRYSAILNYSGDWITGTRFRAGVIVNDDKLGYLIGAARYILPGVRANIEYQSLPHSNWDDDDRDYTLLFKVSTDFAFVRGRFLPTYNSTTFRNRGAIAGRIVVKGAQDSSIYDLGDNDIRIDGKKSIKTDGSGNYFVSNLEKGIHIVELEVENLSIELVPERTSIVAGVVPGATTRVDFIIRPEFGIAGRVTDNNGLYLEGIVVELLDSEGNFLKSAFTDQFGLYRIDGMPPGNYIVRISSESLSEQSMQPPERQVVITNDFLFDQNLQISDP